MHDIRSMCSLDRFGYLPSDHDGIGDRDSSCTMHVIAQCLTVHQFHNYVGFAIWQRSIIIDLGDVGMVQSCCCTRLSPESLESLRIMHEVGQKHFDSYRSIQLHVFSNIYRSHPAASKKPIQTILISDKTPAV